MLDMTAAAIFHRCVESSGGAFEKLRFVGMAGDAPICCRPQMRRVATFAILLQERMSRRQGAGINEPCPARHALRAIAVRQIRHGESEAGDGCGDDKVERLQPFHVSHRMPKYHAVHTCNANSP